MITSEIVCNFKIMYIVDYQVHKLYAFFSKYSANAFKSDNKKKKKKWDNRKLNER